MPRSSGVTGLVVAVAAPNVTGRGVLAGVSLSSLSGVGTSSSRLATKISSTPKNRTIAAAATRVSGRRVRLPTRRARRSAWTENVSVGENTVR
jgi:hypothetical protein